MAPPDHRLTTLEVAQFVADGFLRFDALVPYYINRRIVAELAQLAATKVPLAFAQPSEESAIARPASGTPLSQCYTDGSILGELLRLPEIQGLIASLVGDDPLYDHDFVHVLAPHSDYKQFLHVDAIMDSADPTFDIQLFYFPEA